MGNAPNKGLASVGSSRRRSRHQELLRRHLIQAEVAVQADAARRSTGACSNRRSASTIRPSTTSGTRSISRPRGAGATGAGESADHAGVRDGGAVQRGCMLREAVVSQLNEDKVYPGLEDAIDEFGAEPQEPPAALQPVPPNAPPGMVPKGQFEANPFHMLRAQAGGHEGPADQGAAQPQAGGDAIREGAAGGAASAPSPMAQSSRRGTGLSDARSGDSRRRAHRAGAGRTRLPEGDRRTSTRTTIPTRAVRLQRGGPQAGPQGWLDSCGSGPRCARVSATASGRCSNARWSSRTAMATSVHAMAHASSRPCMRRSASSWRRLRCSTASPRWSAHFVAHHTAGVTTEAVQHALKSRGRGCARLHDRHGRGACGGWRAGGGGAAFAVAVAAGYGVHILLEQGRDSTASTSRTPDAYWATRCIIWPITITR